jgi:protein-serine/threonine kinase
MYLSLKPENVLIDKDGYIKITDFGLSKQNILDNHSTNSFCGTPEYLAPEIINGIGHGKAVDWWSLGAIIYEMLTGIPPFYSKDREKLFNNIKTGNIKYPVFLSKDAISLLNALFVHDPDKRLGSDGGDRLKIHPFFKNIQWDEILNKKIKPPFIPRISNEADTKYIDTEFTNLTPVDSYNPQDFLEGDSEFKGFSFNKDKI